MIISEVLANSESFEKWPNLDETAIPEDGILMNAENMRDELGLLYHEGYISRRIYSVRGLNHAVFELNNGYATSSLYISFSDTEGKRYERTFNNPVHICISERAPKSGKDFVYISEFKNDSLAESWTKIPFTGIRIFELRSSNQSQTEH